jgi:ClpP class serine protease
MNTGLLDINHTCEEHYLSLLNGSHISSAIGAAFKSEMFYEAGCSDQATEPVQKTIGIIPVRGPVQRSNLLNRNNEVAVYGMDYVSRMIDQCRMDENNHALICEFETGGGYSNSVAAVISSMKQYRATGRKIYASVDMACSAGYHIASFCDAIFANSPSSVLGCMGTKWEGVNSSAIDKKIGYINISVTADQTPNKNKEFDDALNGKPALLKNNLIGPIAQHFLDDVCANRKGIDPELMKGATVTAQLAINGGLCDGIMSLSEIIEGITTDKMPTKQRTSTNSVPTNNIKSNLKTPKNTMEKFNFFDWFTSKSAGTTTPEMDSRALESISSVSQIQSTFDTFKLNSEAKIKGLEDSLAAEKALRVTDATTISTHEATISDLTSKLEKTAGTPPQTAVLNGTEIINVVPDAETVPGLKNEMESFQSRLENRVNNFI